VLEDHEPILPRTARPALLQVLSLVLRLSVLRPIKSLTKDEPDAGKDFLAVMRDKLVTLRSALGCR
jgi:hypothetical protein